MLAAELFFQWKSEAETQYINKIKVGILSFKLEEGEGEALSLPPSFLPPRNPKAAPCRSWESGSQPWVPILITWAALKPQTSSHSPRGVGARWQRSKWWSVPWLFTPLLRAYTRFSVWFCLYLRTVLRECRTESERARFKSQVYHFLVLCVWTNYFSTLWTKICERIKSTRAGISPILFNWCT